MTQGFDSFELSSVAETQVFALKSDEEITISFPTILDFMKKKRYEGIVEKCKCS